MSGYATLLTVQQSIERAQLLLSKNRGMPNYRRYREIADEGLEYEEHVERIIHLQQLHQDAGELIPDARNTFWGHDI
eukprot:4197500-Amphidinium_carterae.1